VKVSLKEVHELVLNKETELSLFLFHNMLH
jgi:hypothetical protein